MEAEGFFITVVDLRVRYRRSARYGDVVTIRSRLGEMKSRGCSFLYEVVRRVEREEAEYAKDKVQVLRQIRDIIDERGVRVRSGKP